MRRCTAPWLRPMLPLAFLLAFLLALGCAPEVREGYYGCEDDTDCPSDWVCRADGRCWSSEDPMPVDAGTDGGDGGDGDDGGADSGPQDSCAPAPRPVDLLVMVDDSNSMLEEQASLTEAFPELARALATGDVEGDGTLEFDPVADLHVGVVTSDMGSAGRSVPTCADADFGEDGILRTAGNVAMGDCDDTYPSFLEYAPGGALSRFRADFRCVASAGTDGCGLEQQLEAVLKALTPESSSIRFHADTPGHGGEGANAGFLRDESVLVVLVVTDEDDCSASDPHIFDPEGVGPYGTTGWNLRCQEHHDEALHPISRYADGLRALRPGHPERLVFAALAGVPPDVEELPYDLLLADEDMQYGADGMMPRAACSTDDGAAFPARRIARTADELQLLGSPTLVRSICRTDFSSPLRALLETIEPQLTPIPCGP